MFAVFTCAVSSSLHPVMKRRELLPPSHHPNFGSIMFSVFSSVSDNHLYPSYLSLLQILSNVDISSSKQKEWDIILHSSETDESMPKENQYRNYI
jgi:hypothetical protein